MANKTATPAPQPKNWKTKLREKVSEMMGGGVLSAAERRTDIEMNKKPQPQTAPRPTRQWGEPEELSPEQVEGLRRLRDQGRSKPVQTSSTSTMMGLRRRLRG